MFSKAEVDLHLDCYGVSAETTEQGKFTCESIAMSNPTIVAITIMAAITSSLPAYAQSDFEAQLCEAAKIGRTIELVYDKDTSKGCLPRLVDVHQVGLGNNGQLYLHGWQTRGCTKGRDYESERIFRFDKIQSVEVIEGAFSERSQSIKDGGWDGCIGLNCFIEENICE